MLHSLRVLPSILKGGESSKISPSRIDRKEGERVGGGRGFIGEGNMRANVSYSGHLKSYVYKLIPSVAFECCYLLLFYINF